MKMVLLLICCVSLSCAASAPLPEAPTDVGTSEQQAELERLVRYIADEPRADERLVAIAKLRRLTNEMLAETPVRTGSQAEAIPIFIVQTVDAVLSERGPEMNPNLVDAASQMYEWIPKELVGTGVTDVRHWVEGLKDRIDDGAIARLRYAGAFEQRDTGTSTTFVHLSPILNRENIERMKEGSSMDHFIIAMLQAHEDSVLHLLDADRELLPEAPEERWERQRELLDAMREMSYALHEIRVLRPRRPGRTIREQMNIPYRPEDQERLLALARQPEWPVHLYVYRLMHFYPTWRDPQVIEAITAHQHPISLRFVGYLKDLPGGPDANSAAQ